MEIGDRVKETERRETALKRMGRWSTEPRKEQEQWMMKSSSAASGFDIIFILCESY